MPLPFSGSLVVLSAVDRPGWPAGVSAQGFPQQTLARAWVWRISLAGALYVPTYVLFGALVSPVVMPYYEDPSLGLNLRIPDFGTVLLVQVVLGPVFVLTLLPIVAVLRTSRRWLALWLWLTIAVLGSWVPMLVMTTWPTALRVAHGLEITWDAFVQGVTIAWLIGGATGQGDARSQFHWRTESARNADR